MVKFAVIGKFPGKSQPPGTSSSSPQFEEDFDILSPVMLIPLIILIIAAFFLIGCCIRKMLCGPESTTKPYRFERNNKKSCGHVQNSNCTGHPKVTSSMPIPTLTHVDSLPYGIYPPLASPEDTPLSQSLV